MNTVQIGREFEKEVYEFLKKRFDKVNWISREKYLAPVDFECFNNVKTDKIDAEMIARFASQKNRPYTPIAKTKEYSLYV